LIENTIFHWGSITKTFTGIAIMQLRNRGLLRLEDSVVYIDPEKRTGVIAAFISRGVARDGERRPDARAVLNSLRDRIFQKNLPLVSNKMTGKMRTNRRVLSFEQRSQAGWIGGPKREVILGWGPKVRKEPLRCCGRELGLW